MTLNMPDGLQLCSPLTKIQVYPNIGIKFYVYMAAILHNSIFLRNIRPYFMNRSSYFLQRRCTISITLCIITSTPYKITLFYTGNITDITTFIPFIGHQNAFPIIYAVAIGNVTSKTIHQDFQAVPK